MRNGALGRDTPGKTMKAILTKNGVEICGSDALVYLDGRKRDHRETLNAHVKRLAGIRGEDWADGANLYRGSLLGKPCGKVAL
jgi:hypothetical protein